MEIQPFTIDQYERVKEILVEAGRFDDVWDSRLHWEEKIQKEPNSILVAMEGEQVIGCILIIRDPWTSFLFRFAVDSEYRGKGVGSALLEAAEEALRSEGVDEVTMFVSADEEELHAYYEKRGYKKGGTYRCMYKPLQDD